MPSNAYFDLVQQYPSLLANVGSAFAKSYEAGRQAKIQEHELALRQQQFAAQQDERQRAMDANQAYLDAQQGAQSAQTNAGDTQTTQQSPDFAASPNPQTQQSPGFAGPPNPLLGAIVAQSQRPNPQTQQSPNPQLGAIAAQNFQRAQSRLALYNPQAAAAMIQSRKFAAEQDERQRAMAANQAYLDAMQGAQSAQTNAGDTQTNLQAQQSPDFVGPPNPQLGATAAQSQRQSDVAAQNFQRSQAQLALYNPQAAEAMNQSRKAQFEQEIQPFQIAAERAKAAKEGIDLLGSHVAQAFTEKYGTMDPNLVWQVHSDPNAWGQVIDAAKVNAKFDNSGLPPDDKSVALTLWPKEQVVDMLQTQSGRDQLRRGILEKKQKGAPQTLINVGGNAKLTSATQNKVEDEAIELNDTLGHLKDLGQMATPPGGTEPDFGKYVGWGNTMKQWFENVVSQTPLHLISEDQKQWLSNINQLRGAAEIVRAAGMHKIFGARITDAEIERTAHAFIDANMSPNEYKASYQRMVSLTERALATRQTLLAEGIPLGSQKWQSEMDKRMGLIKNSMAIAPETNAAGPPAQAPQSADAAIIAQVRAKYGRDPTPDELTKLRAHLAGQQ